MRLYYALLFVLLAGASCKKTDNAVTANASSADSISIGYKGELLNKYQIYFSTNVPIGSNVSWDFGDGITSEDLNPIHRYDSEGVYRVRLTVNDDSTKTATRELVVENEDTRKMSGSKQWVFKLGYDHKDGVKTDPNVITEHEQTVVVEMTDPTTIRIKETPLFREVVMKLTASDRFVKGFSYNAYGDANFGALTYHLQEHLLVLQLKQNMYSADGTTLTKEVLITGVLTL